MNEGEKAYQLQNSLLTLHVHHLRDMEGSSPPAPIPSHIGSVYQLASAAALLHNKQPPVVAYDHRSLWVALHGGCRAGGYMVLQLAPGASQPDLLHASSRSLQDEG